jgi:adenylate cyclase
MNQEQELAVLTELTRMPRTVVVVDMVESVRLIERYEEPTIRRWRTFVDEAVRLDAQPLGGRLVKSLGDGMMLEFMEPRPAVQCALAMQARLAKLNEPLSADERMDARIGIHAADVIVEQEDIYGAGVNLAARVATLAGRNEIVVTPRVRDQVVDGLDANVEDLGDCYLKHVAAPIRAYRIGAAGQQSIIERGRISTAQMLPSVAVIPFSSRGAQQGYSSVGDLMAESVLVHLSKSPYLHVVSRLSSAAFKNREFTLSEVKQYLGSTYVLSGAYQVAGQRVQLNAELADTRDNRVVWADHLTCDTGHLLEWNSDLVLTLVSMVNDTILKSEIQRAYSQPLPGLESFTLLLGAISMMHRQSLQDFDRARQMFEYLIERHPAYAAPRAWMGKWYALRAAQGWTSDPIADARTALSQVQRALDRDSQNSLALTVKGLLHGYVEKDFDQAQEAYLQALDANPNEPLAWLYTSTLNAWRGNGVTAVTAAEKALSLSPLDPIKYYFESLAATAMMAAGKYTRSIELAKSSLAANKAHTSTYKTLTISQALSGNIAAARDTAAKLILLEPDFSVTSFKQRSPGRASPRAAEFVDALRQAGVPE